MHLKFNKKLTTQLILLEFLEHHHLSFDVGSCIHVPFILPQSARTQANPINAINKEIGKNIPSIPTPVAPKLMLDEAREFISIFMARNRRYFFLRCGVAAALLLCALSISAKAGNASGSCANDRHIVEPCYDAHGRLRVWADLRARIGIPKTKRIVEIVMPQKPGVMQMVCIDSVSNMHVTPLKAQK